MTIVMMIVTDRFSYAQIIKFVKKNSNLDNIVLQCSLVMKFTNLIPNEPNKEVPTDTQFKEGHTIGAVTVAKDYLFIKKGLKTFFVAYASAERIFRRVRRLHANICCGDGDIEVEYLVVTHEGRECIEVTLPGKKAAQILMEEIRQAAPALETTAPKRAQDPKEGGTA